ncbi:MAG: 50S ribosomal protein L25 [Candidatus Paceibacterota bacterium]
MVLQLKTESRNVFGKKLKSNRAEGKLPAVLYGKGIETSPLFVSLKDFKKIWKDAGESTIINLENENDKKPVGVIIHEVSVDPVKDALLHVDFYKVEMNKPIRAAVSLVFEGVSPAIKELGGVLVKVLREIEIEALPKNLPHEIKVDISKLTELGSQIAVGDLEVADGVKILLKKEEIVAIAEAPREEKEEEKVMTIADIEVEKKGKKPVEGEVIEEVAEAKE